VAPFDLKQQLYLDDYLSSVDEKLQKLKENKTTEEIDQLSELQIEAKSIRKDITKLTKRNLVNRLAGLWAKSQKVGIEVIKEVFVSVTAELAKRLLIGN
jgi:DeoR/GlpR family transcriptional regulator of sugar metabolism